MSASSPTALLRRAMPLAIVLALAACASVPDLGPLPQPKSLGVSPNAGQVQLDASWWQHYGDAQLNQLIDEALRNAPDLAAADARVRKAIGAAQQAGAATLPSVGVNASLSRMKQSYNNGVPAAFVPQGLNNSVRATLDLSYEIDFWGKNRSALAAATNEQAAAEADAAQARLTLSTAIAAAYAELAHLYAQRDAAQQALEIRTQSAQLIKERQQQGLETLGTVRQADSRSASAKAELLAIEESIALQGHQLAALMGAEPERGDRIQRPAINLAQNITIPAQLHADLLGRRPDLTAARLRAEAAAKRIDQSRAEFYPNLNLSAYVGAQSLGLGLFTKAGSGIAGFGPAISLPIFRGGQLQGQYRVTRAQYDEAVANYDQTLNRALQDVADALSSQAALDGRLSAQQESLAAAEDALRIARNRYQGGLATYLDVLTAEDSVVASRRSLSDLQTRRLSLDVALIRALGGGYRAA
ncbi:RND efflux system, outer membrane lipoprotein, NodT family [Pseudogulbenkiania ferrooxidans 2002]|uniref:RND efflux system, outer membrane lipoprotein, NodT family n=2 Tax=Pseudogulbenkiania ferrooxidans TaxID=549169 RepID=B9YZQ7_9NEIS|nr:RND efflux system, outer membrane lipoprotein, NodT family [Pseudogulbenkiania ferrooxidans 2002]